MWPVVALWYTVVEMDCLFGFVSVRLFSRLL